MNYWELIQRYSAERELDPYLIAALIAQESTFTADVRSSANAYGLMQLLPSTGRSTRASSELPRLLDRPADDRRDQHPDGHGLLRRPGQAVRRRALRAGQLQRRRRAASRAGLPSGPGIDRDEFIDDIPFPETQNYVKRILGTAEDYRRLYGSGALSGRRDRRHAGVSRARRTAAEAGKASAAPRRRRRRRRQNAARRKPRKQAVDGQAAQARPR